MKVLPSAYINAKEKKKKKKKDKYLLKTMTFSFPINLSILLIHRSLGQCLYINY